MQNFFSDAARVFADRQASARILSVLPRFLLEGIAFGGMMLDPLPLSINENLSSILPILGLYALAGYKLLPAFQQVYAAMSQLKFTAPAIENLHNEFLKKQEGEKLFTAKNFV